LPPGIASGNGRIEADEIDIVTKFAGRISEMLADEGGSGNRIPGRA
jgi:HlyD family secretion protein